MRKDLFHFLKQEVKDPLGKRASIFYPIPALTVDFRNKESHVKGKDPETGLPIELYYRSYELMLRWPVRMQFQLHISRYEIDCCLCEHVDHLEKGERQYRLQFIIENAIRGGELLCERFIINWKRFKLFEPGKWKHEVTKIEEGRRRLLNLGIRIAPRTLPRCPF
jgi:hypothetical protein